MNEKLKRIDEIFNSIDVDLIEKVLLPKVSQQLKEEFLMLKGSGIKGDDLIPALAAISVRHSLKLSTYLAAILVTFDPNEPFNSKDFIHLVGKDE